jgi:hypothetical protein
MKAKGVRAERSFIEDGAAVCTLREGFKRFEYESE